MEMKKGVKKRSIPWPPLPLSHYTDKKFSAGEPQPLGATIKKEGVNFAVYSRYARKVFLLLFEKPDGQPTDIIRIENRTEHIWHVLVHGVKAGQLYGYKVQGEYNPVQGMRFNEYKLLMDPYAKAITTCFKDKDTLFLPYDVDAQLIKNALCCLLFSLGTPMLLGGDEFMRTQKGNNNAYCQDNEISWLDWGFVKRNPDILDFCKKAIALNKRYTILQGKRFLTGKDQDADNVPDVKWFGENLDGPAWDNPESGLLCYQLDGGESPSPLGEYFLFFILNADERSHMIGLPSHEGKQWRRVVDTSLNAGEDFLSSGKEVLIEPSDRYQAYPRSIVVLLAKRSKK